MEYLFKVSVVTFLIYICYKLFLQRETFFESNRWFLLGGTIVAFITPFIVIPIYITKSIEPLAYSFGNNFESVNSTAIRVQSIDWLQIAGLIYILGVLVFSTRIILQLVSLLNLLLTNKVQEREGYKIIEINDDVSPFSFFNYIVYNPRHFNSSELHQIITHEKVHVNQWHSIDILLSQLTTIICWFNPFVWFYQKALKQNLEFIADKDAQQEAKDSKSYQYVLLKTSVPHYQMALTNNFFNSLIKKRIVMLHKNRSSKRNQLKMAITLPVLALFLMSFNTKEIVSYDSPELSPEYNSEISFGEIQDIIITKNTTDSELDEITKSLKEKGITLKFKGVKRNSEGLITKISISAKTEKSSANLSESDDDGINTIKLTIDGNSISFGEAHMSHDGKDYFFESKDGKHKIHKSKSGSNVFIYSDDEEHEHDEDHEHEVIEDDDKIIIKSGGKVHEIKKVHKDKNVWVISDDDDDGDRKVIEIKGTGDNDKIIIRKDKDGNVIKSSWTEKEGNVWIDKDDEDSIFTIGGSGKNSIFISNDNGKEPLYIIDGKEVSKEKAEAMLEGGVETIEVLKGESAEKKYGKKGKDGVIVITTKKD
jgi:hypothetical protein